MNTRRVKVWSALKRMKQHIYCHNTLSAETYVPPHSHEHGQLIYTEGGRVFVTVGSKIWYLPARHYMWIPARLTHAIQISVPSVRLWIIYFPVWRKEAMFYKKPGIYCVNDLLLELIYFTKNWKGAVTKKKENRYALVSAIKALLPEISRNQLPFDLPIPRDPRLQQITEYLQINISQDIQMKHITTKFNISESTVTRIFRKDLKMSFINYLSTLRVIRAIELITIGELSIKEICFAVGYTSVPSFSNMFKKIVGVRPTAYAS